MASSGSDRLRKIKTFLLDLDGTFYLGDHILPGSLRFIEVLLRKSPEWESALVRGRFSHPAKPPSITFKAWVLVAVLNCMWPEPNT